MRETIINRRVEGESIGKGEAARLIVSNDPDGWVQTHHRDVYRFMKHLTRQRETAEDLTQQTFVNAWKAIGSFDGRSSMRVWLQAIAYREYAAWRRKHRLLAPLESLLGLGQRDEHGTDARLLILDALHKLPATQREAFLLNEVYGHSFDEAAEILGTSAGTLKSRSFYARKRLQETLDLKDFSEVGSLG